MIKSQELDELLRDASEVERGEIRATWPAGHPLLDLYAHRARTIAPARRGRLVRCLLEQVRVTPSLAVFQAEFRDRVAREQAVLGRVLDIGCSNTLHECLGFMPCVAEQFDGLDPGVEVHSHPHLAQRWQGFFEQVPCPEAAYDMAYAYNVVEHVNAARPFFEKLARVLKPGGVFWALTPHSRHPFAMLSRGIEVVGFKKKFSERLEGVNDYSAYYRLNSRSAVLRAIDGLGFSSADFYYMRAPGWHSGYFPRVLSWVPMLYDQLSNPIPSLRIILAYRLQRAQ
jgi:SAM-dependent methyltransferase